MNIEERNILAKSLEKTDLPKAIALYEETIAENYRGHSVYNRLIALYKKTKQFDDAIKVALKYIEVLSSIDFDQEEFSKTTIKKHKDDNFARIMEYKGIVGDLQYMKDNGGNLSKCKGIDAITVIDFETANSAYTSACSIGIVQITGHEITSKEYFLIQPPDNFYEKHQMEIHGLSPKDTQFADTFPAVWDKIKHYFDNTYIAAYNAIFDMTVLKGLFAYYNIQEPQFAYFNVIGVSGLNIPTNEGIGKKLEERCAYYNIELDFRHDALCDAKAAAELVLYALNNSYYKTIHSFIKMQVDLKSFDDVKVQKEYHFGKFRNIKASEIAATIDTTQTPKDDDFNGKVFVFTGELKTLTREQAYAKVIAGGGTIAPNVTKKVDVLVNADVAVTRKVKDAITLQESGHHIKIVSDELFMQMLECTDAICLNNEE